MTNTFLLSGKYQVLRILGCGSFSTVYLARHQFLESNRAIKVIPKTSMDQLSVLSEAKLLKSLRHPGIPIIYDIEEDKDSYYLIEEYIQGESLEDYLLHQTIISQKQFYTYCEQICDIFNYLHTKAQLPIIYRDLKPAHIIVCGIQLKLIDFGLSGYVTSLGNKFKNFGNAEYSAPEATTETDLSTAADIYSLGKLMQYLGKYVEPPLSQTIQSIIHKAIDPNPELRYETVEALWSEISKKFILKDQSHLLKKIAVVGSCHGCGATHFAISLVSALNFMNAKACYFECNDTNALRNLAEVNTGVTEQDCTLYYKNFMGLPKYGPGITVPLPEASISVMDVGTDVQEIDFSSVELILLLLPDAPWRWQDATKWNDFLQAHRDTIKCICNPGGKQAMRFYAKYFSYPVYPWFWDENAFLITREKLSYFTRLLEQKGQHFPCFHLRKKRIRLPK